MADTIRTLRVELEAGIAQFQKEFAAAGRSVDDLGKKFQKLGAAEMREANREALKLGSAFKSLSTGGGISGALSALGPAALGVAAGFGAISAAALGVGKVLGDLAGRGSELSDLSAKTQIGVESLQRMGYAGSLVGVSIEQIAAASLKLDRALIDSPGKFAALGLSVQNLLGMNPEQRFEAISNALRAMPEGPGRTAAAFDLLGKSAGTVLPYLTSDLANLHEEASRLGIVLDEETVKAADALDDALTRLGKSADAFKLQLAAIVLGSSDGAKGVDELAASIGSLAKYISDNRAAFELFLKVAAKAAGLAGIGQLGALGGLATEQGPAPKTPIWKPASIAPPSIDFAGMEARAQAYAGTLGKDTAAAKAAETAQKAAAKAAAAHEKETRTLNFALDGQAFQLSQATKALDAHLATWRDFKPVDLAQDLQELNAALGQGPELDRSVIGSQIAAGQRALADSGLGAQLKASFKTALADLPAVILGAFQGGGNVGKAIGAHLGGSIGTTLGEQLGPKLSAVLGKTLGGALGSLAGPLGSILGSLAGNLLGKIGGLFGGKQKEVNNLRDAFFEAQGGFVELQKKLSGLSNQDLVKKIFDAKTVEQFNAAVSEVMGLLDTQQAAQEALKEATDRYGFSIAELGPAMRRQELDKQAGQLLQDFKLLTASGIDVGTVLSKMGPDMVDFVNTSRAAGQAIPEAMRPMIDQLIASGQLLDENGNAFTSAEDAGITFAQTMTEQFQTLIEKIDSFVSALLGIPSNVSTTVTTHHENTYSGKPPDADTGDVPSFASGGVGNFGSGTLAMLHGREAIVPLDRIGSGGVGGAVTVNSAPVVNIQMANAPTGDVVAELERALDQHAAGLEARFSRIARRAVA
jgi:hypothetical protein